MSRRRALGYSALGISGMLSAGSIFSFWRKLRDEAAPADVFKGDAPTGELWEQWQARGWVKEAYHYLQLGRNVQCKVCPNNCLLEPGDRSHCRNKVNQDGTLLTMVYGNPCTFHVDPIEKKPLYHFLPGSPAFSLATSGCIFRCLNCQNWEISQKKPEETKDPRGPAFRLQVPLPPYLTLRDMRSLSLFPDDVVQVAQALGCPSIAYTYSEPTAFYEYAYDTCKQAREQGLKNVLVTCGSTEERPLRDLGQFVDASHVDLKGFDEAIYRKLNSGRLETILKSLELFKDMGIWFEVINLVVPTYTDDLETIGRMCGWLVEHLGPDYPLHFSRFHPEHKLEHLPPTPVGTLLRAREIARSAGLHYVYLGNVRGVPDAGTTFCPGCQEAIIERDVYSVTHLRVKDGKCAFCQREIAGVWAA